MTTFERERVHLGPPDDEDLYTGYGEYSSALSTQDLEFDPGFQQAIRTSYGRRPTMTAGKLPPGSSMRLGTSTGYQNGMRSSRGINALSGFSENITRPMTAVRGAGFTSSSQRPGQMFDPLNQAAKGPSPSLEPRKEDSPEEKIKLLERKVNELIEESCLANSRGELRVALDRAKEASSKERSLIRMREQAGLSEGHNLDLTFSVLFNLANQYSSNEMYTEALNTYQVITKNRMFNNSSRLKVNMGNIYFKLGQYPRALKFYRMALDQVPNTHKNFRIKIMHNIGILFVRTAQYTDACANFEQIMLEKPDFQTGLHLILCYYALANKEKMKRGFEMLLEVPLDIDDEEKYTSISDDPISNMILEVIKNDTLRKIERHMRQQAEKCILTAAKLISPSIATTFTEGYDWCLDAVKASNYAALASDLEINKAIMYLRQRDSSQAISTLRAFEKKETKVASTAATNLSFIYFMQGDLQASERYAEMARSADGYNAAAFVNLANCFSTQGDLERGKELYICALDNDASCVEALYNLGIVNKRLGLLEAALDCFLKLQAIVRHHPQVLYQIAILYEQIGEIDQSTEWYLQLLGLVPTDPGILQRMGEMFDREGDKQQAYQYHYDSYRYYPSNFEVIDWLGSYFVDMQVAEKAIIYFERAALMQPDEVRWQLMVASCHRRSGNYHQALDAYKRIHRKFPDNTECLKFLVRLCSDLGLKEAADYAVELKRAEKAKELRDQRAGSSRPGSRRSSSRTSRGGSAASPFDHLVGGTVSPISRNSSRGPHSYPGSARSLPGGRQTKLSLLDGESDTYIPSIQQDIDASYADPLGPMPERPRTSAGIKHPDDEFGDEDLGDDLLPE